MMGSLLMRQWPSQGGPGLHLQPGGGCETASMPLKTIARALIKRLPDATSAQLEVLRKLWRKLDACCEHMEQYMEPVARGVRS